MSWISEFADKAEQMLVKLDQNAAEKLNKKNKSKHSKHDEDASLMEVTTEPSPIIQRARLTPPLQSPVRKSTIPLVKSAPTMANRSQEEEKLIDFLNDSSIVVSETEENNVGIEVTSKVEEVRAEGEKQLLKNEVRVLNNELSLLLHRTKAAERESETLKSELKEKETIELTLQENTRKLVDQIKSLEQLNYELTTEKRGLEEQNTGAANDEMIQLRAEIQELSDQQESLRQRLDSKERDCLRLESALQQQEESSERRLADARNELEQYRARAQRTLGDKEALISQLRAGASPASDAPSPSSVEASLTVELAQLREERRQMSEEAAAARVEAEAARARLAEAERTAEGVAAAAGQAQRDLLERLDRETGKRRLVEDDFRIQAQELRQAREERVALSARLRERESELAETRRVRAAPAIPGGLPGGPGGELEMRLSSLTRTLIHKQTALESATTERNQLRMQLEELEHKHREHLLLMHQARVISANDTDDAKAQVPSFMVESPFDTGVARRVKRAYSSLDAISIRTGVFLRRYPLARILVVLYVGLLHSLVLMVLYSRTPENKGNM